ncbi:MAG: IS66 family transposase [Candidatus Bathyarchaeota archaeon]
MSTLSPDDPLPDDPVALQALVRGQRAQIAELEQRLAWFLVQYRLAQHRRFAASSETTVHQLDLFAELLAEVLPGAATSAPVASPGKGDPDAELPAATRGHGGRRSLPAALPRETVVHDLADEQKACPCCGEPRVVIGEERSEQLEIEPPRLKVLQHVRLKYACPACALGGVQTAPPPPQPIPKSFASPGLLAWIVTAKIADGLPLYRQEAIFRRLGIDMPRQTLAAWLIRLGQLVQPLINLLHDELLTRALILADETRLQVLREAGRAAQTDSWLWCYRSGPGPPIILFEYTETRAGKHPQAYLDGFEGYLLTDGLSAYEQVGAANTRPTLVGCWSHARRYFHDLVKARPKTAPPGLADEALTYIGALFHWERHWTEVTPTQRQALRQRHSAPIVDQFKAWLDRHLPATAPKTLLGKAIRYTLRFWSRLTQFLGDGRVPLSNNRTEQAIKKVVIGRKNFLFAASPAGARALANLYALVETAQANGWDPWAYLTQVFTQLPCATTVSQVEALLPGNLAHGELSTG